MNNLISKINAAIEECKKRESEMTAEMSNIMPKLEKLHYINGNIVHMVERQYNEKIGNVQRDISEMESHVKELEKND
jgi:hypothetical protein